MHDEIDMLILVNWNCLLQFNPQHANNVILFIYKP